MFSMLLGLVLTVQTPQVTPAQIEEWFEAGQHQQVVDAAADVTQPAARYLVALSHQRLGQLDEARGVLSALAERGDDDPWSWIARSTRSMVAAPGTAPGPMALDAAQTEIDQALALLTPEASEPPADPAPAPTGPAAGMANYQQGQILTYRQDYEGWAAAFDRAITALPSFAYAHYYAGMSYREITRIDQMANHFDQFLELAPEAPERTRVRAMMRTVRGR